MKRLRVYLARLLAYLSEPRCTICRQRLDRCVCDPYWDYF